MKVLLINGSFRRNGCTFTALNEVAKALNTNGIDTEIFTYDEEVRYKVREKNGWQDRFVVGHVGSFTYPKNHEFLIDIFEELVNRIPNAILVLVGKGPLQKKIEKKVSDKNLADSVVFLGNRSDIAELNQAMDIFVFPSHYEGLPVTLIEAQATGLPCIISDTVTNEVYITDRIQKCSLKSAAFVWAEQIKNTNLTKEKRTAYSYEISVSGYDMAKVAQNLKKFYCS